MGIGLFSQQKKQVHKRLFRDVFIIVLLVIGAIVAFIFSQSAEMRQTISHSYIHQTIDQALKEFKLYFSPIERSLGVSQKWGRNGRLDLSDVSALNAKFIPLLEEIPQLSGMTVASTEGEEYFLTREGNHWLTRSAEKGRSKGRVLWQQWTDTGVLIKKWNEKLDYDPRERPWFIGAINSDKEESIFWTDPYTFFTTQKPGITGSLRWQQSGVDNLRYVVAFDVFLSDIFEFISSLHASKNSKVFLFDRQGSVFRQPQKSAVQQKKQSTTNVFFTPIDKLEPGVVAHAAKAWKEKNLPSTAIIELTFDKKTWWAGYQPLYSEKRQVSPNKRQLWIAVVTPQSDFLGEVRSKRGLFMGVALLIVAVSVLMIIFLVKKYSGQLKDGIRERLDRHDLENEVMKVIGEGEGNTVEFKSTIRMNLKSGKAGKEIEIAWLKTIVAYMNTDGGILLLGVSDAGDIVGIEPDGFDNDDKCYLHFKNLINQHIGLEVSRLLTFELVIIQDRKIVLIEVEPAKKPVFLNNKNEECFYIRSGPASMKLTTSKVIQYLEHRK